MQALDDFRVDRALQSALVEVHHSDAAWALRTAVSRNQEGLAVSWGGGSFATQRLCDQRRNNAPGRATVRIDPRLRWASRADRGHRRSEIKQDPELGAGTGITNKPPNWFYHNIGNLAAFLRIGGCLGAIDGQTYRAGDRNHSRPGPSAASPGTRARPAAALC